MRRTWPRNKYLFIRNAQHLAPELISVKSYAEAILAGERKVTLRSDLGDQVLERREEAWRNGASGDAR